MTSSNTSTSHTLLIQLSSKWEDAKPDVLFQYARVYVGDREEIDLQCMELEVTLKILPIITCVKLSSSGCGLPSKVEMSPLTNILDHIEYTITRNSRFVFLFQCTCSMY